VRPRTALWLAIAFVACSSRAPAPAHSDTPAEPAVPPPAKITAEAKAAPTVVLAPAGAAPIRVTVELARTNEERRRGLMYRQNLAPDTGMLFLFEEDEIHGFWMKNTLISLDMIFIRADGTVAGVVENAAPRTLETRTVGLPSRHVLEVIGGYAKALGIAAGTKVSYENIDMRGL
jgi:uncharacterized protein